LHTIWPVAHVGGGGDASTAVDESSAGGAESNPGEESTGAAESTPAELSPGAPGYVPGPPPASVVCETLAESSPESSPVVPTPLPYAPASGERVAPLNPSRDTSAHPDAAAATQSEAVQRSATPEARR
jgi:hypothetical protein